MSGAVPAKLAAGFTLAELAVLSAVAGECRRHGTCSLPIDALAACAGVCRRVVQNAIRAAEALGLLEIRERPRPGAKHLPHLIRIISPLWRQWLKLGGNRVQNAAHHEKHSIIPTHKEADGRLHFLSAEANYERIATDEVKFLSKCQNPRL